MANGLHRSSDAFIASARMAIYVTALAAMTNCGGTSPAAPAAAPSGNSVTETRIRIDGPTQVAPGESPRYTAIAEFSDGSSKDVTATATWLPTDASFPIHFIAPGIAAPAARGETTIIANPGTVASLTVRVLEPGTFTLRGPVLESGVGPLYGATIEVLSGIGAGLRSTSGAGGYSLYGVSGPVHLRASADGFTSRDLDVVVNGDATQTIVLTSEPAVDVSGVWTMSISPAPACRSGFPDIARGRSYQVNLIQNGTQLKVRFSSPTLRQYNPDEHSGTVHGSQVRLYIIGDTDYGQWSYPDIFDQLSPTEEFGFTGTVDGTMAGSEIRATMDGDLMYFKDNIDPPPWYCRARDHIVTLRR